MTKILIVEENQERRGYLQALFAGTQGFSVAGTCSSVESALSIMEQCIPDVVITCIKLQDRSGIELIMELRKRCFSVGTLVLTGIEERGLLFESLKAGASGCILKEANATDIIRAVEDVLKGGTPISPQLARLIADEFKGDDFPSAESFTARELEVLAGIAEGLSEKRLAEKLKISCHTVHAHVKTIYRKLQVNSKVTAIMKARSRGLV